MADVFISYASGARSRAELIAKALKERGWSVWWDRAIRPGKSFDKEIEEAITASKCVVVLWSKESIESDWVKEEAIRGKERKILVPAKIDPVELPFGFGLIQAADLTDWKPETSHVGFASFLSAISDIVGPPPQGEQVAEITESKVQKIEKKLEKKDTPQSTPHRPEPAKVKPSDSRDEAWQNVVDGIPTVIQSVPLENLQRFIDFLSRKNNPSEIISIAQHIALETDPGLLALCLNQLKKSFVMVNDPIAKHWIAIAIGTSGSSEAINILLELRNSTTLHPLVQDTIEKELIRLGLNRN